ncbi:hypothetical protein [Pseudotamlana agarivorans]|uniref:hypothetical protein n=1 Tax=Pseudotamlana agarivorans TaxID=481183 RepID=UPI000829F5C0|nr:hypothetical protein [Tamlana agarivorans]
MRRYKDMKHVDQELKILKLQRAIAWEEIKGLKEDYKEDFKLEHWLHTALRLGGQYGLVLLFKKIMNR